MNVSKDIPTPETAACYARAGMMLAAQVDELDKTCSDLERRLTVATEQLAASRAETVQAELKASRAKKQLAPLYEQLRMAREAIKETLEYMDRSSVFETEGLRRNLGKARAQAAPKLCPIFDCENRPMTVGDSFHFQKGKDCAAVATIYLLDGTEWLSFSDETPSTPLVDFWHAPTDAALSEKITKEYQP